MHPGVIEDRTDARVAHDKGRDRAGKNADRAFAPRLDAASADVLAGPDWLLDREPARATAAANVGSTLRGGSIDPAGGAGREDLNSHGHRLGRRLVAEVVSMTVAGVDEALAGLVHH